MVNIIFSVNKFFVNYYRQYRQYIINSIIIFCLIDQVFLETTLDLSNGVISPEFQSILDNITELQKNIRLKPPLNYILQKKSAFKFMAFINFFRKLHIKRRTLDKLLVRIIDYNDYDHFNYIMFWTYNYKIRRIIAEAFVNAVNIGWLSTHHSYPSGDTSAEFHAKLFQLCLYPHWGHRGYHQCDLESCSDFDENTFIIIDGKKEPFNHGMHVSTHGGKTKSLGAHVIIVTGENRNYAAPDLIFHYVAEHNYRPPDEFIDAVMESKPFKCAPAW